MIIPTPEQLAVLGSDLGPLRIAAGAGTGKTTTVALLVADLVEKHGIEPEEILGITFTTKAAAELADRIRSMVAPLAGVGRESDVHTYHGFAAQLVREFGALVGVERGASVITPTFSRQLLFEVLQRRRFSHLDSTWAGSADKIQRLGSALGDHLADPEEVAAAATEAEPWPERLELLAAWGDYQAEKSRLGVVDYTDLISAAVRLLAEHPDVGLRVRERYRVVLLDEYQDTNPAQRIMLQSVFGDGFPVVAVGDSDQTIYEWRGATPDNFDGFADHFPDIDGTPAPDRRLSVNRRSDRRIISIANEIRRRIGSQAGDLQALPEAGEGHVATYWAADAVVEAGWIADRAIRLHDEGTPWREIAVLFRKNRHIALVHDAFVEREIPVEVANLGGLLSVPEVADVRAWMRVLHAPEDGPALIRILMGPRLRLGMGDLVHLTDWATQQQRAAGSQSDEVSLDHERLPAHTMLEAVDHLEDIAGLDDRARQAIDRFRRQYRRLLAAAQSMSLAELTRTILDVTGTWPEVEAMGPAGRLTARLNLYRFLDLAEEWSPLEGRPSLAAFLAHLDLMEENPADELDAARLSGEDAVALLTVHRAKGLEWDVVFLPAITKGNFPAKSSGFENPYTRSQWLPHEWRLDRPPDFDATTPTDEAEAILRERHLRQEWRAAYVAATRARHRLYVTGAYWYGMPNPTLSPTTPSELFDLVAGSGVAEDLGTDPVTDRPEVLRAPDRQPAPDPLFVEGWAEALRTAVTEPQTVLARAEEMGLVDEVRARSAEYRERLFELDDLPVSPVDPGPPATSVTGLVTYAACPRRHYWSEVDRLPRRPSPAARRGVDVHRRIELHGLGHVPLRELDPEGYDVVDGEGVAGRSSDPYQAYLSSEYASRMPLAVEVGFSFETDAGLSVRGRIDSIYPSGDGWEIVDFKSGRRRRDAWLGVQLQAYAIAARRVDFGHSSPRHLAVSFVYLGDGLDVDRQIADAAWMDKAESTVESLATGIVNEEFEPVPSEACRSCEFSRFCPAGTAWLEKDIR
ncbi:MAG TPA: ATP-dependent DNA helicase [Acidimicrobiia bacterium]|nr:ATP-dependent DNA helicase [Acidimicrobiia bacterium]